MKANWILYAGTAPSPCGWIECMVAVAADFVLHGGAGPAWDVTTVLKTYINLHEY